jgi:hypothetical protein
MHDTLIVHRRYGSFITTRDQEHWARHNCAAKEAVENDVTRICH